VEKKVQKQARKREQILEGAARVFAKKGYHATTVEEIAKELGMTKAGSLFALQLVAGLRKRAEE
jgi:AcrR family transcriptional regulator